MDILLVPGVPYTHVNHYSNYKDGVMKPMFEPVDKIDINCMNIKKYIKKLHENIDSKKYPGPYIVMGHSHGIYFACEFAKQFSNEVKCIVSLDGSWITRTLNKKRMENWKVNGKKVEKIDSQEKLDKIVEKIKYEKDNQKYIDMIFNYVRMRHTKRCIKAKYEKLKIPFYTFRDFNVAVKDDIQKTYNEMVIIENDILNEKENHYIYILLDASHIIWTHQKYKNLLTKTIGFLIK